MAARSPQLFNPPASPEGEAYGGQARGPQYDPSDLRGRHGETVRQGFEGRG